MADLNLHPDLYKNGDERFLNKLFGIFASSRGLAFWVVVSVGRSAVCFFIFILNNAPALRAGIRSKLSVLIFRGHLFHAATECSSCMVDDCIVFVNEVR